MTTTSEPLVLERDRDAYATIRGFVLQVDRSIMAWMDLGADDILELERGEDIDHIAAAVESALGSSDRVLEQVKHSEGTVTLRTAGARAALSSFFEHRRLNRELRLRFRFTTTAIVGREQKSTLPGRLPGIAAWEEIRRGGMEHGREAELLRGLRDFLSGLDCPPGTPDDEWARLKGFLASADDLAWAGFVRDFEWSTGAPTPLRFAQRSRIACSGISAWAALTVPRARTSSSSPLSSSGCVSLD